jgi:chromosome segregation ATPase
MELIFSDEVLHQEMTDPTLDSKRQHILSLISSLYKAYGAYTKELTPIVVGTLEEDWEAAKTAARNKKEEIERFRNEWDESVLESKRADALIESCQIRLANINKPKASDYPSKKEMAAYNDKVQKATAALDAAVSAQQDITSYSQWKQREIQLNAEMSKLVETELNIRRKLEKYKPQAEEVTPIGSQNFLYNDVPDGLGNSYDVKY